MTIYNVHLYREMRLFFEGIEAESPEAAAVIARDKPTGDASDIEDCNGEDLGALVDVQGDADYEQSVGVDFEPERQRKAAAKMLAALTLAQQALNTPPRFRVGETDSYKIAAAVDRAVAEATAAGIPPALPNSDTPTRFEYTHEPDETPDRAFVLVDDLYDVAIIRTAEGIVIDVYPKEGIDTVATMTVWDDQVAATPPDHA